MGDFDFMFGDFSSGGGWGFDSPQPKKKKGGYGKWIAVILILIVGYFAYKGGMLNSLFHHNTVVDGSNQTTITENDNNGGETQIFTEKGYYTDQYIVKTEFMDTVRLNNKIYYVLRTQLKSNEPQNLNMIAYKTEAVFYNPSTKTDAVRLTIGVDKKLNIAIQFRPVIDFSRKYVPLFIFSNTENIYDYILIDTGIQKNNPIPPGVKASQLSLSVYPLAKGVIVQDNVIYADFIMQASVNSEPVFGVLVEMDLPDDYTFTKSGSQVIIVPTLTGQYKLRLYIEKNTGKFMSDERIPVTVKLQTPTGLYIQKKVTVIINGNE